MSRQVCANVNGVEDIISLEITGSSGITRFSFTTTSSAFSLNDEVSIYAGFADEGATLMSGALVDSVTAERPPALYRVEGRDKLKRALDHFIVEASLNKEDFFNVCPGTPGNYTKVTPGEAISSILALCGLPGVSGGAGWELGTEEEGASFQLVSAWDAIQQVCSIGAWRVWCDSAGTIQFGSITQPVGGGGTLAVGDAGQIISASYSVSDEDLRNKIVVIGAPNPEGGSYSAVASAAGGFVKTAVISTDLIGSDAQAEASAAANLVALNKPTQKTTVECTGVGYSLYNSVGVSEPFTGAPGGMITSIAHTIDSNGYRTKLTARVV